MKIIPLLALCLFVVGCTDKENQAKLAAIEVQNQELKTQIDKIAEELPLLERYKMFNGGEGAFGRAFLYDTQTGRVWRYYRQEDKSEGFIALIDPSIPLSFLPNQLVAADTSATRPDTVDLSKLVTPPSQKDLDELSKVATPVTAPANPK